MTTAFIIAAFAIAVLVPLVDSYNKSRRTRPGEKPEPGAEQKILEVLNSSGTPMIGPDIMNASNGEVTRTNVYVQLATLEDDELVHSRYTDDPPIGGARRREYSITSRGRFELKRKP